MRRLRLHIIPVLLAVLSLSGCGSLRLTSRVPSKGDIAVSGSIDKGDIIGLIRHHGRYPGNARSIEEFLASNVDYDALSYTTLKQYRQAAEGDEKMEAFFQGVLEDRQESVLEKMSRSSYEEMGAYYRAHPDEREFLRGPLMDTVYPELDHAEYALVRHLHRAFSDTDLSPRIDQLWAEKRALLLPEAEKAIRNYFNKETQLEAYYRERTLYEIQDYVDGQFPMMMERCLKEVENGILDLIFVRLKTTDIPLASRVESIVNSYIPDAFVQEKLQRGILALTMDVHKYRRDLAQSLTMDGHLSLSSFTVSAADISYRGPAVPREIPNMIESMVEKTRKYQNLVSIGSLLFSFVPGVGWVLKAAQALADGADLLYGIASTVKEKQEVVRFIQSFSKVLYETEMNSIELQFNNAFDALNSFIKKTRTNYVDEVHEAL